MQFGQQEGQHQGQGPGGQDPFMDLITQNSYCILGRGMKPLLCQLFIQHFPGWAWIHPMFYNSADE